MKKKSKSIKKNYLKLENNSTSLAYYGILMKNDRARIDTKRYRKFFEIPDKKIEHRNSVYYIPSKKHRSDYLCNRFYDLSIFLKQQWNNEYSRMLKNIKTPKEVEDDIRVNGLADGILEYDEANINANIHRVKRTFKYNYIVKTLYAQFFQQMMSQFDALALKVIVENGYKNKKFSREEFDTFIQGKQNKNESVPFYDYKYYFVYDKAYRVWNLLKHNSEKAYSQLVKKYSNLIINLKYNYQNGDSAIEVLKIDEELILITLDELPLFFNEVCQRGFGENPTDAKWDYDDYFIENAKDEIEFILNPLGLPDWL